MCEDLIHFVYKSPDVEYKSLDVEYKSLDIEYKSPGVHRMCDLMGTLATIQFSLAPVAGYHSDALYSSAALRMHHNIHLNLWSP